MRAGLFSWGGKGAVEVLLGAGCWGLWAVLGRSCLSPLLSELALEDLTAGAVLVPEAELGTCVEDILKVPCLLWVRKRAGLRPSEQCSVC